MERYGIYEKYIAVGIQMHLVLYKNRENHTVVRFGSVEIYLGCPHERFSHNFRDRAGPFLVFCRQLRMAIEQYNFYMVEYCEIFKMTFQKFLIFCEGSKFALKLPQDISHES